MNRNKKRNNTRRQAPGRPLALSRHLEPPPLATSITVTFTARYQATAQSATPNILSPKDIAGSVVCPTVTNMTGALIFESMKVNWIKMWAGPASGNTPSTISIEFASGSAGSYGRSRHVIDTSIGTTRNAHCMLAPDPHSQAAQWHPTTVTTGLVTLAYVAGTVVDVNVSYTIANNLAATTVAISTGTVGNLGRLPLDGPAGELIPVGYTILN